MAKSVTRRDKEGGSGANLQDGQPGERTVHVVLVFDTFLNLLLLITFAWYLIVFIYSIYKM